MAELVGKACVVTGLEARPELNGVRTVTDRSVRTRPAHALFR